MLNTLIDAAGMGRRAVARIGTLMGYVAGWGFLAISALITFDVLGRRFFGISTQATTELSGYALAFGMAWGLAHTLSMRAHITDRTTIDRLTDPSTDPGWMTGRKSPPRVPSHPPGYPIRYPVSLARSPSRLSLTTRRVG